MRTQSVGDCSEFISIFRSTLPLPKGAAVVFGTVSNFNDTRGLLSFLAAFPASNEYRTRLGFDKNMPDTYTSLWGFSSR